MSSYDASHIIANLGAGVIASELGFTERNLRHARTTGKFAGGWYSEIKALCERHGVFCPMSAFSWKVADKKNGNAHGKIQGEAAK